MEFLLTEMSWIVEFLLHENMSLMCEILNVGNVTDDVSYYVVKHLTNS